MVGTSVMTGEIRKLPKGEPPYLDLPGTFIFIGSGQLIVTQADAGSRRKLGPEGQKLCHRTRNEARGPEASHRARSRCSLVGVPTFLDSGAVRYWPANARCMLCEAMTHYCLPNWRFREGVLVWLTEPERISVLCRFCV